MSAVATPVVEVDGLHKTFGEVAAVDGVSFGVQPGSIVGLIGPNGSGKTTTLNLINGAVRPDRGNIRVDGRSTTRLRSSGMVKAGVTRTFQNPRVFNTVTAMENMLVPVLHQRGRQRVWQDKAQSLLEFVNLGDHRDTPASELSGGQQKLLEFVRALVTEPRVVLMDEPFAGVHPSVKELMRDRIRDRNRQGTAFVIVSHEIPDLMRLCSHIICLADGAVVAQGAPSEVTSNPMVIDAYLGRGKAGRGERG